MEKNGYKKPLKVQEKSLKKAIHMRNDMMIAAETGSGKTLTYIIPIIHQIECIRKSSDKDEEKKLRAIIMTPTRELATQVHEQIMNISKEMGIYSLVIIGGMSQKKHERLIKKRPEIIVATPGRLWAYMNEEKMNDYIINLSGLKVFVVDEVDRMIEKGHYEELEKICEKIKKEKQIKKYILSATLMIDKEMNKLKQKRSIEKLNYNEKIIKMLDINIEKANIIDIKSENMTPINLEEKRLFCDENEKEMNLYLIIKEKSQQKTLVFFNKVENVKLIGNMFRLLKCNPILLFGKQKQKKRFEAVENFNKLQKGLLFTTDVAARGLDFVNIDNVIHYDVPLTGDCYVHRSGRTARCNKKGKSILFVTPSEIEKYNQILKILNRKRNINVTK